MVCKLTASDTTDLSCGSEIHNESPVGLAALLCVVAEHPTDMYTYKPSTATLSALSCQGLTFVAKGESYTTMQIDFSFHTYQRQERKYQATKTYFL